MMPMKSVAAIAELVKTKDTTVPAAKLAALVVIAPVMVFRVTAVALLVACVTVPPAPVLYPMPAVGEDARILSAVWIAPAPAGMLIALLLVTVPAPDGDVKLIPL